MTVNTSHLHQGNGGIWTEKLESSIIAISWLEDERTGLDSKIKFLITNDKNSDADGSRSTNKLNKTQNYDLEINFDGHSCNILVDGLVVGDPIDCSIGLGNFGSPEICYADAEGRWLGKIINLKFETWESK